MAKDYRSVAGAKARKYGLPEWYFKAQIGAESGYQKDVITGRRASSAGAQGIAQIMPATARGWGVNPLDPEAALDAAAKNMAKYVKAYGLEGALRAYNAGPGAVEKSKAYGETNAYVKKIMGQRNGQSATLKQPSRQSSGGGGGIPGVSLAGSTIPGASLTRSTFDAEGFAQAGRRSILANYFAKKNPNHKFLRAGLLSTAPVDRAQFEGFSTSKLPGLNVAGQTLPGVGSGGGSAAAAPRGRGAGGAAAAVNFGRERIGQYAESTGSNRGPRLDTLQKKFGFSGAPWCAMFTSVAATRGGMPKSGRTASVAVVRQQVQSGNGGYHRGFRGKPRAGDMMLFANRHIAMVDSVNKDGTVNLLNGNGSDGNLSLRKNVAPSTGDFARPKYKG